TEARPPDSPIRKSEHTKRRVPQNRSGCTKRTRVGGREEVASDEWRVASGDLRKLDYSVPAMFRSEAEHTDRHAKVAGLGLRECLVGSEVHMQVPRSAMRGLPHRVASP